MTAANRATRRVALLVCAGLLTACAAPRPPVAPGQGFWSGRLALQVESEPPQSLSAGFDLTGSPEAGELVFTSPLGTTLATVRWRPGLAEMQQGTQVTRHDSLAALTTELGGTALPVAALFAWLRGTPEQADGWVVDLSRHADGRITAQRQQPAPAAQLRIVFQP